MGGSAEPCVPEQALVLQTRVTRGHGIRRGSAWLDLYSGDAHIFRDTPVFGMSGCFLMTREKAFKVVFIKTVLGILGEGSGKREMSVLVTKTVLDQTSGWLLWVVLTRLWPWPSRLSVLSLQGLHTSLSKDFCEVGLVRITHPWYRTTLDG